MEKGSKVYEAIRELILLGFFTRSSFWGNNRMFLGEYQFDDKKYEIYWYFSNEQEMSIFIKCENNSIHLALEEAKSSGISYSSLLKDVYIHINKYLNVDFNDVMWLCLQKYINKENIIYSSKIQLDYSRMDYMYRIYNKRYILCDPDMFDKKLENKKCIEVFEDEFSPEIMLNLIEQIHLNIEQIRINNKIDGIINSLSQEELLALKTRLLDNRENELEKKLSPIKHRL